MAVWLARGLHPPQSAKMQRRKSRFEVANRGEIGSAGVHWWGRLLRRPAGNTRPVYAETELWPVPLQDQAFVAEVARLPTLTRIFHAAPNTITRCKLSDDIAAISTSDHQKLRSTQYAPLPPAIAGGLRTSNCPKPIRTGSTSASDLSAAPPPAGTTRSKHNCSPSVPRSDAPSSAPMRQS